jgi:mannitol 2-dehydrogenase
VGVQFVPNVLPYEKMKLRLLNSTHQALCYLGFIKGYRYVHEAAGDILIQKLLARYMKEEVEETLDNLPDIDLGQYQEKIIERFSNPNILDTLSRICEFTSDRVPQFNLISNLEIVNKDPKRSLPFSTLVVASWVRYLQRVD